MKKNYLWLMIEGEYGFHSYYLKDFDENNIPCENHPYANKNEQNVCLHYECLGEITEGEISILKKFRVLGDLKWG